MAKLYPNSRPLHIAKCVFLYLALTFISASQYNFLSAQYYYFDDFTDQASGATADTGNTPWTTSYGGTGFFAKSTAYEGLVGGALGTTAYWYSGVINIPGTVNISFDISEHSVCESDDYIALYYSINGGAYTLFDYYFDDFGATTSTFSVSGSTLQLAVVMENDDEIYAIDKVVVEGTAATPALYTAGSGDWDDGNTWSSVGYGGADCNCFPGATTSVYIGNGNTINLNVDGVANDVTIENTGTLLYTANDVELNIENDGLFTINSGGSINENGYINADLDFESGSGTSQLIVNSGANFDIGRLYFFGSNTVNITGAGEINLSGNINFTGEGIVTNSLSGDINVTGGIVINTANSTFNNYGTIYMGGDYAVGADGSIYDGNTFNSYSGGRIDIGGDIDANNGNLTINNRGVINLYGTFANIDTGSDFNNLGGGTWAWYHTGSYDTDLSTIFTAQGLFEYEGFGDQLFIPMDYNNITIDGSGSKILQADINVRGVVYMNAGYVSLNDYDMVIGKSGAVNNGNSGSFILTDGTGSLVQKNIGVGGRAGTVTYPIGTDVSNYTPLTISNSGTADQYSVRVCSGIYEEGTCGSGTAATSSVVNRTWFIEELTAGGSSATLNFQWTAANELSGFDRSLVNVIHHDGSVWESIASTAASGTGPYTVSASGVTSFSPFGIEGGDEPLPVELTDFRAELIADKVKLSWTTASELSNDYFTVERSTDLTRFEAVKQINGQGDKSTSTSYVEFDNNPKYGLTYYRLKQTDYDGGYSYSKTLRVHYEKGEAPLFIVYPNPSVGEEINLKISNHGAIEINSVKITDIAGRSVACYVVPGQDGNYSIKFYERLSSGIYLLTGHVADASLSRYFAVE